MAETESAVKGNLSLEVDEQGLEALIRFQPDAEGGDWGPSKVRALLAEKGIVHGVRQDDIDRVFQQAGKSRGAAEGAVAQGVPPEQPVPERIEWADAGVPDDIAGTVRRILQDAPPPDVVRVRVEKRVAERTVQRKPKLPFMPVREEVVKVTEKEEIPERVAVDPTVVDSAYVEAETVVAKLYPARQGKPGKSIFGKPLPPVSITEPAVYLGSGLERRRSELVATATGILRRGRNWADVLPYQRHQWSVHLSRDRATCYLSFDPGDAHADPPDAAEIIKDAVRLGYAENRLLDAAALRRAIGEAVASGTPLQRFPISTDRDAEYRIDVTEDRLRASLYVRKGAGRGKALALKEVGDGILASKLKGLDLKKIRSDILEFYRSDDVELKDYVLVEGTPPGEGSDGQAYMAAKYLPEEEVQTIKERVANDPSAAGELASLTEFPVAMAEHMALAHADRPVMRLDPPVSGEDGQDVFGEKIPGRSGKPAPLSLFENLKEDGNTVVPTIDGILDVATLEESRLLRVRPHRDSVANVVVAVDGMRAFLTLRPAVGSGEPLTRERVSRAIERVGVRRGVNEEIVEKALAAAIRGESVENLPFAAGRAAKDGSPTKTRLLVQMATGKEVSIRTDGTADYRNQDHITFVNKGQELAEIVKGTEEPEPGYDVKGGEVPPRSRQEAELEAGRNVHREERDGRVVLVSDRSGELLYDGRRLDVHNLHLVNGDVDLKTGNVKFSGAVRVKGSVMPGFFVVAGEEVTIDEVVQSALVSSGGDLTIGQGVKGGGKAVLRSKASIHAAFVEQAVVLAVGDVQIRNACLLSRVKCNGSLVLETERGNLVGGVTEARKGVHVANLGSESGSRTEISFGQDYLVKNHIEKYEKEVEKVRNRVAQLDALMKRAEAGKNLRALEETRIEKLKLLKLLEKHSLRLFTLRESFERHFESEIVVRGTVYPGVVLESHGRSLEVTEEKQHVRFRFDMDQGRIVQEPL